MQNRDEHMGAMLRPDELTRAWRVLLSTSSRPPVYVPYPEPEDRPAPGELAEILERMKSTLRPATSDFRRAAEIVAPDRATDRCPTCTLDFVVADNPKGCPRCRLRVIAWRGAEAEATAPDSPSLDDALEMGLAPKEDDLDDAF